MPYLYKKQVAIHNLEFDKVTAQTLVLVSQRYFLPWLRPKIWKCIELSRHNRAVIPCVSIARGFVQICPGIRLERSALLVNLLREFSMVLQVIAQRGTFKELNQMHRRFLARILSVSGSIGLVAPRGIPFAILVLLGTALSLTANGQAQTTSVPAISPAAGTYAKSQQVTITDATAGAAIYYTVNGSAPTTASAKYSGPITVSSDSTVQAVALASGDSLSSVMSASYSIRASTTIIEPVSGTYTSAQSVTITSGTAGAAIYYTTDGATPTTASKLYAGPFTVSTSATITAMAVAANYADSWPNSVTYTIDSQAAAPTLSLPAGTYVGTQTVAISDSTSGASIYFTSNGSTPTTTSTLYKGPISVAETETIEAVAIASGGSLSPVVKAAYIITPGTAAPVISPAAGTYYGAKTITLSDTTSKAVIYYTINGKFPNSSSTVYSGPFTISTNSNIQAIAEVTGAAASSEATASYSFPAKTPVIHPAAGTYLTSQTVSMTTSTSGASIYYTTNGTAPSTGSIHYTGPFTVSSNETIEAIAAESGMTNSSAASSAYKITPPAPTPTFSPAAGTYLTTKTVTINCSDKSAVIYYTTNGSIPTTNSTVYSVPLAVGSNETITAMALASGGSDSPVASATYTITLPAATPTFSPAAGKYTSIQSVILSDTTSGAAIYYTTDGSAPTTASSRYTGPISVGVTETLEAAAIASGGSFSPVAKAGYIVTLPTAVPVISPPAGTYNTIQTVTISDVTPGAVIYYTVNGDYPKTTSPIYSGPITATTNTLVQAIAAAPSESTSAGALSQFTIVAPPPSITPSSGTFDYTAKVTMSSPIAGATIYYTTNGTAPSTSSTVYTGPISLSPKETTTEVYEAIAIAPGYLVSAANSSTFVITLPSGVIAEATVSPTPQMTIPPDFMGLSADYITVSTIMGQTSTSVNQIYRTLINNLTRYYTAPLLYRVEGDNTTAAELEPAVEPLAEFAQAVNVNYTLGVDLMNGNPATSEAEASQWVNGIPNDLIQAIEIGNEPDLYGDQGARVSPYDFVDYLPQFQQWQQGIQATIGSKFGMMGPSAATSVWKASTQAAFEAGTLTPVIATQHAYCAGPATGQTLPPDYMLEPINATKLPSGYAPLAAAAHQAGFTFRMGEMNSIGGSGILGISNTFQTSLWSVDIMFNYLVNGMDGVNWHSGLGLPYDPIDFTVKTKNGTTTFTLNSVNPVYYGLLTFAQIAGRGAKLLPVAPISDSNVSIWATVDNTSTAHLIVINKDEAATGNIVIKLPGYTTGTVRYLSAPSYSATNGVTLGGQTFDGTPDGTIQGKLVTSTITAQDGVFTLANMPTTTAAIIDFSN